MDICIPSTHAPVISCLCHLHPARLMCCIELHFIPALFVGCKKLGFPPLFKKLLMFLSAVCKEEAAARRNLKRPRCVLVRADLPQEPEADSRACQGFCIVVTVDLGALKRPADLLVAVEAEGVRTRKPPEDDMPAERPPSIPQEFPITSPDLEITPGDRDFVKGSLTPRLPTAKESDRA